MKNPMLMVRTIPIRVVFFMLAKGSRRSGREGEL